MRAIRQVLGTFAKQYRKAAANFSMSSVCMNSRTLTGRIFVTFHISLWFAFVAEIVFYE